MMTAAKMVLHDWQRGRIPFFVPPPQKQDDPLDDNRAIGTNEDSSVNSDRATAAMKAIANVISSQQLKHVPVQRDLFGGDELEDEKFEQLPSTSIGPASGESK